MGKNTMMRKAIRGHLERNPALEKWVRNGGWSRNKRREK
jgi:hypothetical protein